MKLFLSLCTLALCLLPCLAGSAQAGDTLSFKGKQILLHHEGAQTALPTETFALARVEYANGKALTDPKLWFCAVGTNSMDGVESKGTIAPGLYLFGEDGRQIGVVRFAPEEAVDLDQLCSEVRLSPGEKVLAMDIGGTLMRLWLFFSYPEMKPMGQVSYLLGNDFPSLIWTGDTGVLVSDMDVEEHKRACGYDPCGPVSVNQYSFATQKLTTVFAGTDLCDFRLAGYEPQSGKIEVVKLCLKSPQAWQEYPENAPTERVFTDFSN